MRLVHGALLACLVGCRADDRAEPAPRDAGAEKSPAARVPAAPPLPFAVADVTPRSGEYGTLVTIRGEHLLRVTGDSGRYAVRLELTTPEGTMTCQPWGACTVPNQDGGEPVTVASGVVESWKDAAIVFRYPFPADGAMRLVSDLVASADLGTFEPTWAPGQSVRAESKYPRVLEVSSSSDQLFALLDDGTAVVTDRDGVRRLVGGLNARDVSHYVDEAGQIAGFYLADDALHQFKVAGTRLETSPTGVSVATDKPVVAAGRDAQGPYVWTRRVAGEIVRLRPPAWTVDRGPIAEPAGMTKTSSAAVAPDGTLWIAWGINSNGSFPSYDHQAFPVAVALRSADTAFATEHVNVGSGVDDYMAWTHLRAGPSDQLAAAYCASDHDTWTGTAKTLCSEGYHGVVSDPSPSRGHGAIAFGATATAVAFCNPDTETLEVGLASPAPDRAPVVFPCARPITAGLDGSGRVRPLVMFGNRLYAPRPRLP